MDSLRLPFPSSAFFFLLLLLLPIAALGSGTVFSVQRRFSGGDHTITDLKNHDLNRHGGRLLSAASIDFHLGGNGLPNSTGLYFTEIGIGTPPKNFSVQVDTGSDILWVNCAPCEGCPKTSILGVDLSPYDPEGSSSISKLGCGEAFCSVLSGGGTPTCAHDDPCKFTAAYGDGSSATGYYVTDLLTYNQVSDDHKTRLASANVTFGCASKQTGASTVGIEGLMGFGQANSSTISQLASSGKARKIFAHCLDTIKGGGIFAVGNVVEPKVKMTPLIPKMLHYNVNLTSIDVGGKMLRLPFTMFQTREKAGTIIDSGTTLAYLPEIAYKRLIDQIFLDHRNLTLTTSTDNFTCFSYSESMDDAFPVVTFNFEMNVTLEVKPHDYFFKNKDVWCIGWQNNGDKDAILLGDITLSNRLVIYDLENQAVGWTDYDCSSNIKIEDDTSKAVNSIDSHALPYDPPSSASILEIGGSILLVPLVFLLHLHN